MLSAGHNRDGIVFGRYLLSSPIGRGGMAEVWRARLVGANDFAREVVVKRILPHLSQDPQLAALFTVEAKISASLNHPNIVQVFDFASVGEELYLAMEYVAGANLAEVLGRLPPDVDLPVGMAAQITRDVCLALHYAHESVAADGAPMRIIHRDVSPANIMLRFDGNVKLVDFGIAKVLSAVDDQTRTGVLRGKLGYLSPEAATGELEVDHRIDIFGAGVVLHELLTRRRLFKGRDDLNTLALVRKCEVAAPSTWRAGLPPELDDICMTALARDRDDRFATAGAMADALARVVHALAWDERATAAFLRRHDIAASTVATSGPVTATAGAQPKPTPRAGIAPRPRRMFWLAGAAALTVGAVTLLRPGSTPVATVAMPMPRPLPRPVIAAPVVVEVPALRSALADTPPARRAKTRAARIVAATETMPSAGPSAPAPVATPPALVATAPAPVATPPAPVAALPAPAPPPATVGTRREPPRAPNILSGEIDSNY